MHLGGGGGGGGVEEVGISSATVCLGAALPVNVNLFNRSVCFDKTRTQQEKAEKVAMQTGTYLSTVLV